MVTTRRTRDADGQPQQQHDQPTNKRGETVFVQFKDMMMDAPEARLNQFEDNRSRRRQGEDKESGDRGMGESHRLGGGGQRGQGCPSRSFNMEDCERHRPDELSISKVWKDVHRHNPERFEGRWDPIEAEGWIDRLETIFSVVECNEYQKATVAIILLEGNAMSWWKCVGGMDDSLTTWDKFKTKFFNFYFPPSVRLENEMAFYDLQQGDMHVDDYITTFINLSRYVPNMQHRDDQEWKAQRLIQRARPDLRVIVRMKSYVSFEDTCIYLRVAACLQRDCAIAMFAGGQNRFLNFPRTAGGGVSKKYSAGSGSSGISGKKTQWQGHGQGQGQKETGYRGIGESHRPGGRSRSVNMEDCQQPRPDELSISKVWKDVHRHNPERFEGRWDPIEAEGWIDRLETIFSVVECNEYQKARVAIILLVGDAMRWWKCVGGMNDSLTTWDEFKTKFFDYYSPLILRQVNEMAFYNLQQGDMHEDNYIATFIDLSRYVTHMQYRDDQKWKAQQLIQRARPDLRVIVRRKIYVSFEDTCINLRVAARLQRNSAIAKFGGGQNRFSNFPRTAGGGVNKKYSAGSCSSRSSRKKTQWQGRCQGQRQDTCIQGCQQMRHGQGSKSGSRSQQTHRESVMLVPSVVGSCAKYGRTHPGQCWERYRCQMSHSQVLPRGPATTDDPGEPSNSPGESVCTYSGGGRSIFQ